MTDAQSNYDVSDSLPPMPAMDVSWGGQGPEELHLGNHQVLQLDDNHWNSPYRLSRHDERASDLPVEQRRIGDGHLALIVPTYLGWYRALEEIGNGFSPLSTGRSWRFDITIAPIGFVGTFRRSRVSRRWFTGRHKAHSLGLDPAHHN